MPNESGLSTLAALRREKPWLPAVLMSGYSEAEFEGDEIFLAKPFRQEELVGALRRALEAD